MRSRRRPVIAAAGVAIWCGAPRLSLQRIIHRRGSGRTSAVVYLARIKSRSCVSPAAMAGRRRVPSVPFAHPTTFGLTEGRGMRMSCSSRHTRRFDALLEDALKVTDGDVSAAADLFLGWVLSGEEPVLIKELAHA